MACKQCGKDVPVLKRASKPEGQKFVGMCKPCIKREMSSMRRELQTKVKEFLKDF